MNSKEIMDATRAWPGKTVRLQDRDPGWAQSDALRRKGKRAFRKSAKALLEENLRQLSVAQELLYADDRYAVLIVFQAMDAAGKDGTIKHVMSAVNPQGCQVFSFKQPSAEELDHNFLWRHMKSLPERGRIGIFNRSHYEDVLIVKVHPELLQHQQLPPHKPGKAFWKARYDDINAFEEHLARNGTLILKFFLHISKEEQKERFLARLDEPEKNWKFSASDLAERAFWDSYQKAYEEAINATSTKWAPWFIIPADHKWVSRTLVADIVTSSIQSLDLKFPSPTEDQRQALVLARQQLLDE